VLLAAGGAAVLGLVYLLVLQLGLPDWVLTASLGLVLVGLPFLAATGWMEGRRAAGHRHSGGFRAWLTWRRAWTASGVAFGVLGLATAGYMLMRALGIGPVGTLVASGVLAERDRLILTDFENKTGDSLLAETVGELFRVDLAQSRTVTVLEPAQVSAVLQRMQRDPMSRLTPELGREIAQREGLKAVVAGELLSVGSGFVVSIRLVGAASGDVLLADRESAAGADQLVTAVDRLSGRLRERIGESLRSIRGDPPLEQVTTSSTDALRRYAEADRANNMGDYQRAMSLLQEAVAEDTGFAMAWRKLGVIRSNTGGQRDSVVAALTHAYRHLDRLTERERYQTLGSYHMTVTRDRDASIGAYRSLLERYPDDRVSLNNLALQYFELGRWGEAEALIDQSLALGSAPAATYVNAVVAKVAQGKYDAAEDALRQFERAYPGNPSVLDQRASLAAARGRWADSERYIRELLASQAGNVLWRSSVESHLAALALVRGKLAESERHQAAARSAQMAMGLVSPELPPDLLEAADRAAVDLWLRGDPESALRRVESALARHPRAMEQARAEGGPMLDLAHLYASAGRAERARQVLADYQRLVPADLRREQEDDLAFVQGAIAMAEGRYQDAVSQYRGGSRSMACPICALYELGSAYRRAGQADSAVAAYQRYLTTPWLSRLGNDTHYLARVLHELGELEEQRGNRQLALEYYGRFVELWKDADPDLQATVRDVKGRMAKLGGEGG
jgi:tetratricopeptide (TPR) repeat protein